jgi:bacterioferritin (cytochrome b1)
MASNEPLPAQRSRRAFLRTAGIGVAASSTVMISSCGGESKPKQTFVGGSEAPEAREDDVELLNGVLALEHAAIAAYTAGIPLLSGHGWVRIGATRFLGQELQHAQKLEATIRGAGGKPTPPQARYHLGTPRDAAEVLEMLRATESALIGAYLAAIPQLTPGWLRAVAAGILANESQHVSVLRAQQGRPEVPGAFVTGAE